VRRLDVGDAANDVLANLLLLLCHAFPLHSLPLGVPAWRAGSLRG
jgi:hypothetical protein